MIPAFLVRRSVQKFNVDNINIKRGFIFIHIPKNAGSSVNDALEIHKGSHYTAEQYRKGLGWRYRLFFSFCFTRNPWSRFLSLYNFARMEESYYHSAINPEKAKHGKHMDYDILKNASLNDCAHLLLEGKLRHDKTWNHWRPQTNWACDKEGKLIVDFAGKVENIGADFAYITQKTGMNVALPLVNASGDVHDYRKFYDPETRDIVASYYAGDIEKFNYSF